MHAINDQDVDDDSRH